MQAGNGTAPAPGGGAGGRPTFDQILWMALGSNPGKITSWTVLGVAMVALLTGKIFLDTGRYYEFFHHRDNKWVQIGVAVGTIAATANFSLGVAQAWKLSRHAFTDFASIRGFEATSANVNDLIGTHLQLAASTYYAYRAYKMSGRKIGLAVLMFTLIVATYTMSLYVNIKGVLAPHVTIDTVRQLKVYNDKLVTTRRAWGALAITSDGLIMLVLMYYLISARESVFHKEQRVYHKLVILTLGTMLPSVVCITLLVATVNQKGSPTADYRKVFRMLVPTLFWVSLLHSLVARATIRQMLGTSLASNGMLKPDVSTQAGESVFVAIYGAGVSDSELADSKTRDLEAGGDEQVVPVESYQRDGSPISDSSKKIKPAGI